VKSVIAVIGLCCLASVEASAGGVVTGTVKHVYLSSANSETLYIAINGTETGSPACSSNATWQFALDLVDLSSVYLYGFWQTELLAAEAAGATVTVYGAGTCILDTTVEDISGVKY
jgi:hypothetical protein